jgi:hypothetical protein
MDSFYEIALRFILTQDYGYDNKTATELSETVVDLIQSNPDHVLELLNTIEW